MQTKATVPRMRFQTFSAYFTSDSCAFTPSVYTKTMKTMQNDEKRVSIWKRFWRWMIRFRNQKRFRINTGKRKNDLTSVISDDMIGCIALELLFLWQLSANLTSNASRRLCKNESCKRESQKWLRCVYGQTLIFQRTPKSTLSCVDLQSFFATIEHWVIITIAITLGNATFAEGEN